MHTNVLQSHAPVQLVGVAVMSHSIERYQLEQNSRFKQAKRHVMNCFALIAVAPYKLFVRTLDTRSPTHVHTVERFDLL